MMNVVITGASSGIGAATARELAKAGHRLVLAARRQDLLLQLSAECLDLGAAAAVPVPCDITDPYQTQRMGEALADLPAGISALINNAGIAEFGPTHELGAGHFRQQVEVNLLGQIHATLAVLQTLRENAGSFVVHISSIVANSTFPNAAGYCAAKAGAKHFFDCLARDYRKEGLRVTNVVLGATDTPIWTGWKPDPADMIPATAVAETVRWLLEQPADRAVDRIDVLPPKGLL